MKKSNPKNRSLSAVGFRYILITLMIVVIGLSGAAFWFGFQAIKETSHDLGRRQADAEASSNTLEHLRLLQNKLDKLSDIPSLARSLKSPGEFAQFETEKQIRNITSQLNIPIDDLTFSSSASAGSTTAPSAGTGTTSPAPAGPAQGQVSFTVPGGLKYEKLIQLLDAIETNSPKLTVESVTLSRTQTVGYVDPGTLTITIATE